MLIGTEPLEVQIALEILRTRDSAVIELRVALVVEDDAKRDEEPRPASANFSDPWSRALVSRATAIPERVGTMASSLNRMSASWRYVSSVCS
jgi:hypothetical protein